MKLKDRFLKSSIQLAEIGNEYLFGLAGKEVNIPLAHEYFVLAAAKGNLNAMHVLDTMFAPDKDELCDEMKVGFDEFRKLRLAVEAGDPVACYFYGVGKLSDEADDYIYHKGLAWVKHSAEWKNRR